MRGLKLLLKNNHKSLHVSHPTRMRGLKSNIFKFTVIPACRIPRGCVDWNSRNQFAIHLQWSSHPTRMRGLKFHNYRHHHNPQESHPTRMRGLKYKRWSRCDWASGSHSTRMRGLKFTTQDWDISSIPCRIPRGCVDWNISHRFCMPNTVSRIPRGCVDWNRKNMGPSGEISRRIPRGCVDLVKLRWLRI